MAVEIKVPNVGESVKEGMISSWHKKDGELVAIDEVLLELETDKATVEIVAEQTGLLSIIVQAGQVVKVGEKIGVITPGEAKPAGAAKLENAGNRVVPPAEALASPLIAPPSPLDPGPAVRRLAAEHQLNLAEFVGSGKGGRPVKAEVLSHLELEQQKNTAAAKPVEVAPPFKPAVLPPTPVTSTEQRATRREPLSMLRRRVAERLLESQRSTATLTTFNEVDMSAIIELRKKYQDKFQEKYGIKLGFMGFFLKACVAALREFPRVNAAIDANDIIYHDYCDIGVAVSTDKGLMVPVIRNVERLTLAEIEAAIALLAKKGRDNKISLEDLSGGTFTVSNGGIFGSLLSTPILNPPQSGILGMHKTELRPVVAADMSIVVRPMMYVALSYDHRIIDGKESVGFLIAVKNALEDPSRLVVGV